MEKNLNDGTSFHQSDKPILCANGCGFFGTAATMNLCSKCYRDVKLKEEQAASIVKTMTSSSSRVTSPPPMAVNEKSASKSTASSSTRMMSPPSNPGEAASVVKSMTSSPLKAVEVVKEVEEQFVKLMTSSSAMVTSAPVVDDVAKKGKSRCGCCNKKVGVMGFKCRCGTVYCGSHRYPELHSCEFDFKSVGREAIKKDNPIVKADKIQRF